MTAPRRRIAVVVPTLDSAGAERVARSLAGRFAADAHVTVVTFDPRVTARELARRERPPWSERVPAGCAHVHLPATGSGPRRLAVLAARFARLARRQRFEVVYTFLTYPNVVVAVSRLMSRGRYVHVASEHALADNLRANGRGPRMLAATLPAVYRLPDHIVVVSDAARGSLQRAGVLPRPERAVTIPNPIDVAVVRTLAAEPVSAPDFERLSDGGFLICCFARLHPQKDHRTLMRAVSMLSSRFRLAIVGDGPLRDELGRFAEDLRIVDRTLFHPAVDNPYPLMRRAGVLTLASREEGFGLVALEAAALGVPFVGTEVGGLAELCARLGQPVVAPGDARALADAFVKVSEERRDAAATSPARLSAFDLRTVAMAYRALAGSR